MATSLDRRLLKNNEIIAEEPLPNEKHETFCQEYIELGAIGIRQRRARRVAAYRKAFDVDNSVPDAFVNQRAQKLLDNEAVEMRIHHLLDEDTKSLEAEAIWNKMDSEEVLLELALNERVKPGDRIKAIQSINEMRGYDKVKVDEESTEDDVFTKFVKKITNKE